MTLSLAAEHAIQCAVRMYSGEQQREWLRMESYRRDQALQDDLDDALDEEDQQEVLRAYFEDLLKIRIITVGNHRIDPFTRDQYMQINLDDDTTAERLQQYLMMKGWYQGANPGDPFCHIVEVYEIAGATEYEYSFIAVAHHQHDV